MVSGEMLADAVDAFSSRYFNGQMLVHVLSLGGMSAPRYLDYESLLD